MCLKSAVRGWKQNFSRKGVSATKSWEKSRSKGQKTVGGGVESTPPPKVLIGLTTPILIYLPTRVSKDTFFDFRILAFYNQE